MSNEKNEEPKPKEKVMETDDYPIGMTVKEGDTIYIGTSKRWIKEANESKKK